MSSSTSFLVGQLTVRDALVARPSDCVDSFIKWAIRSPNLSGYRNRRPLHCKTFEFRTLSYCRLPSTCFTASREASFSLIPKQISIINFRIVDVVQHRRMDGGGPGAMG
jgi:hypothetical protein